MTTYLIRVVETRTYTVDYEIEATTEDEATNKAERGETVRELPFDGGGDVLNREVIAIVLAEVHT